MSNLRKLFRRSRRSDVDAVRDDLYRLAIQTCEEAEELDNPQILAAAERTVDAFERDDYELAADEAELVSWLLTEMKLGAAPMFQGSLRDAVRGARERERKQAGK